MIVREGQMVMAVWMNVVWMSGIIAVIIVRIWSMERRRLWVGIRLLWSVGTRWWMELLLFLKVICVGVSLISTVVCLSLLIIVLRNCCFWKPIKGALHIFAKVQFFWAIFHYKPILAHDLWWIIQELDRVCHWGCDILWIVGIILVQSIQLFQHFSIHNPVIIILWYNRRGSRPFFRHDMLQWPSKLHWFHLVSSHKQVAHLIEFSSLLFHLFLLGQSLHSFLRGFNAQFMLGFGTDLNDRLNEPTDKTWCMFSQNTLQFPDNFRLFFSTIEWQEEKILWWWLALTMQHVINPPQGNALNRFGRLPFPIPIHPPFPPPIVWHSLPVLHSV